MKDLSKVEKSMTFERELHFHTSMTCCSCCARTVIGIVNFIVLLILGLCVFIGWAAIKKNNLDTLGKAKTGVIMMIVVFVFVAIVCILGFLIICFGNIKCYRVTYAILFIVVVVIEIVIIAVAIGIVKKINTTVQAWWDENKGKDTIKSIEEGLECCGYKTPYSEEDMKNCGYHNTTATTIETCTQQVDDLIKAWKKILLGVGIFVIVIQVIVLAFALYLAFWYEKE